MNARDIIWIFIVNLVIDTTYGRVDCPSKLCRCERSQVASKSEISVRCNIGTNNIGFVPVFEPFDLPIHSLTVSGRQLRILGNQTFNKLAYIREFYLNDNSIGRIDTSAFDEIAFGIEVLDLQHNQLRDLTFLTTQNFESLRELLLRDNQLEAIRLDSLATLPNLEKLNLDDNQLTSTHFLRQPSLVGLTSLNMDANRLTTINLKDFIYLTNLKALLLNHNQLNSLQFISHERFKQLRGLSLAGNNITEVPIELFSDKILLRWIDLSSNHIHDITFLTSCSLRSLEEVYLSGNLIETIPDTTFQATDSLLILDLSKNRLQTLPGCLLSQFYPHLEKFNIEYNPIHCDCNVAWLQEEHRIQTEHQAFCENYEALLTTNFDASHCSNSPKCSEELTCKFRHRTHFGYQLEASNRHQSATTPLNGTAQTLPQIIVVFVTILFIVF